jgi:hypothetical protein
MGAVLNASREGVCLAYPLVRHAFESILPPLEDRLARSQLFGKAVRLVFHDAGEIDMQSHQDDDTMGPDGCLSDTSANGGLLEDSSIVMTVLEPIWQTVCDQISRADFWVLFAQLSREYQYGRRDAQDCSAGEGRLPSGQAGLDEINQVFVTQMGLTMVDAGQTVACCSIVYLASPCL